LNCTDFEKRLNEQLGAARFDETADLAEHARRCPRCRDVAEQFHLLMDSVRAWRVQIPDVELAGSVVAARRGDFSTSKALARNVVIPRAESDRRLTASASMPAIVARAPWLPGRLGGRAVRWLVAGAAVLFVVGLWLTFPHHDAPPPARATQLAGTTEGGRVLRPADVGDKSPSRDAVEQPAVVPKLDQPPYYDLAQKAAGAFGDVTAFVMPGSGRPAMSPANPRVRETGGWIDGLQHQLKPIGRSLDHAFDFLWEAGQSADGSNT
jgi:hypothetical protein